MRVVPWVTESMCARLRDGRDGGGGVSSPFPCSYRSASDGTSALVLHMPNALGGSRWIEMKKAPIVVAS